jgi:alpha-amylase
MAILYESDVVLVFRRGNLGIVAINKGATETWVEFSTFGLTNPGVYQDLIHQHEMELTQNLFTLYIPPRTAQMWLLVVSS